MDNTETRTSSTGFFSELNGFLSLMITLLAVLFPLLPNFNLSYLITNFYVDGLLIYQLVFASLSVIPAFGLLYIVSRLAKSDQACGPFKKYLSYGMSVLFIILFSGSMKEVYAPTNSFTEYFIEKESNISYALVQDEAGIEYKIEYCNKSGQQIRCNINLYNKTSETINITDLQQIYLYDQLNRPASFEKTIFNSTIMRNYGKIHLTSKSKSNIDVYFNVKDTAQIKQSRELSFNFDYSNKNRHVTFMNVPISKTSS